jgi:hypothetical protein
VCTSRGLIVLPNDAAEKVSLKRKLFPITYCLLGPVYHGGVIGCLAATLYHGSVVGDQCAPADCPVLINAWIDRQPDLVGRQIEDIRGNGKQRRPRLRKE